MLAGKYLQHAGIYPKALRMFLAAASSDPVAVDYAIETVGMAGSDSLTHELIDFLMGERDGIAKVILLRGRNTLLCSNLVFYIIVGCQVHLQVAHVIETIPRGSENGHYYCQRRTNAGKLSRCTRFAIRQLPAIA